MQTIITKFIPATDHKPARVKAYQQNEGKGKTVTLGWDDLYNAAPQSCRDSVKQCHESIRPHALAARRLMMALDWFGEMIAGHSDGGTVWVFSESSDRIKCTRNGPAIDPDTGDNLAWRGNPTGQQYTDAEGNLRREYVVRLTDAEREALRQSDVNGPLFHLLKQLL